MKKEKIIKNYSIYWILFFLGSIAAGVAAFYIAPFTNAEFDLAVSSPVPVAAVRVSETGELREFPGKVRAKRRIELAFFVPGLISLLEASEGSRVEKGAVIARLDDRDYRYALNIAKTSHEEARSIYERKQKLLDE